MPAAPVVVSALPAALRTSSNSNSSVALRAVTRITAATVTRVQEEREVLVRQPAAEAPLLRVPQLALARLRLWLLQCRLWA